MKVFVVTKAELMEAEQYVAVFQSEKAAEKFIRSRFPNAQKDDMGSYAAFLCKRIGQESLMFIHREEVGQ